MQNLSGEHVHFKIVRFLVFAQNQISVRIGWVCHKSRVIAKTGFDIQKGIAFKLFERQCEFKAAIQVKITPPTSCKRLRDLLCSTFFSALSKQPLFPAAVFSTLLKRHGCKPFKLYPHTCSILYTIYFTSSCG